MLPAERKRLYLPFTIDDVPSLNPNKRVAVKNVAPLFCYSFMEHAMNSHDHVRCLADAAKEDLGAQMAALDHYAFLVG